MSKEKKYYCARCNQELKGMSVYISDIDYKFICNKCFLKEQPKELAKQIAELKAENERLKEEIDNWERVEKEYLAKNQKTYNKLNKNIDNLQQQLKEKDEEIERLKREYSAIRGWCEGIQTANDMLKQQLKTNTHQVCEKIRQNVAVEKIGSKWYVRLDDLKNILAKIEKGRI